MDWRGRRVLVTGAGGFIGSHLAETLARRGAQVRAMVRYTSDGRAGWLQTRPEDVAGAIEVFPADIRDRGRVQAAVQGCEAVFHLAALISIPWSYEAPESYVDTNVRGTLNVLEACRGVAGVRLVHTSTSEVYGTPEQVPISESHPVRAQSPYAATKAAADQLALSYHASFGVRAVVLRPFNTYGPRQSTRGVLPTILAQLLTGRRTIRLGSLWPRRDLTYVDDTVAGFIAAAESDAAIGRTVQLGTGRDVSIRELADLIMRVLGVQATIESVEARTRPEASEVRHLRSSPDLARELLGWQPQVALEDGITRTADWMRGRLGELRPDEYAV
jgi:NAD dependent epimerase/dehydratase